MQVAQVSNGLFKIIRGFNHPIKMYTDAGTATVSPDAARRFYLTDLKIMITVRDDDISEVVISLSNGVDVKSIKPMLTSIRTLATQFMIGYTIKSFGKEIQPKDFAYQTKNIKESATSIIDKAVNEVARFLHYSQLIKRQEDAGKSINANLQAKLDDANKKFFKYAAPNTPIADQDLKLYGYPEATACWVKQWMQEPELDNINEGFSKWSGTTRKSYQKLNDAHILIKHKKNVDDCKRGARTRQIESIFIENNAGERFLFAGTNIPAARAMLKHVNEGGTPYDAFGKHIMETLNEITQLRIFNRYNNKQEFFEDNCMINEVYDRIVLLMSSLKQIAGTKGYKIHNEDFKNQQTTIADGNANTLNELTNNMVNYFDEAITNSLPYIAKIIEAVNVRKSHEDNIQELINMATSDVDFNSRVHPNDPENPDNLKYPTMAAKTSAMCSHVARFVSGSRASNILMNASASIYKVSPEFVTKANNAIKDIKNAGNVFSESTTHVDESPTLLTEQAYDVILTTFSKYDIDNIF